MAGKDDDIIDAEFVSLPRDAAAAAAETAPRAMDEARRNREKADLPPDGQLGVFGKRDGPAPGKPMSLPLFTFVAVLASVAAFLLSGGFIALKPFFAKGEATAEAVAAETAAPAGPLQFENIISNVDSKDGRAVMNLRAVIANHGDTQQVVPPVIVTFGDDPATRRTFRIDRGETLGPGEKLIFTNRFAAGEMTAGKPKLEFGGS